jgi:hypothetical protein
LLRYKYDTLHDQYMNVKEERDVVNHDYNDRVYALTVALRNAVTSNTQGKKNDEKVMSDIVLIKEKVQSGKVLTAEEATAITIQTLTQKIEQLNLLNGEKQDQITELQERFEDVVSDNDAKVYKIMALEKQFCNINTKRNKVVTKYQNNHSNTIMHAAMTTTKVDTSTKVVNSVLLRPLHIPDRSNTKVSHVSNKEDMVFQDNKDNIIANIVAPSVLTLPSSAAQTTTTTSEIHEITVEGTKDDSNKENYLDCTTNTLEATPSAAEVIGTGNTWAEPHVSKETTLPTTSTPSTATIIITDGTGSQLVSNPVPITPEAAPKTLHSSPPPTSSSLVFPVAEQSSSSRNLPFSTLHNMKTTHKIHNKGSRVGRLVKLVEQV